MIEGLINSLIDRKLKMQTIVCEVLRVTESVATCDCRPVNGAADFLGVRLQSAVSSNQLGLIAFPAIGSLVMIGLVERKDGAACVLLTSELSGIKIKMQEFELSLNDNQMLLNGGLNGGLVVLSKLVERLNAIERAHNELLLSYNLHFHAFNTLPPTIQSTASTLITQVAQIENTKIKH